MNKSKLRYLGFLGFLGLLSLVTSNAGFAGFFGYFGFFAWTKFVADERFQINVGRAATNAFVASVVAFPCFTVYAALVPEALASAYAVGFAAIVAIQLLVFSLSLAYYER